ncbi:MAG: arginase family protein [Candidatus Bathyarchaeia archaeon]
MAGTIVYPDYLDPYDYVSENLPAVFFKKTALLGKIQIPTWLRPKPTPEDLRKLDFSSFTKFIRNDGCFKIAIEIRDFIVNKVFPRVPGMIGVDHSSTYGAILAIRKHQERELGLIVLDSHFDAIPAKLRQNLFDYAKRSNIPFILPDVYPQSSFTACKFDQNPDSHVDAENFLLHLINHRILDIKNLVVIGNSDYPSENLGEINDPSVKEYEAFFRSLEKLGAHFVPRSSLCRTKTAKNLIEEALGSLNAKRVYISMDVDVGALSCVYAARFLNAVGLSLEQIQNVFQSMLSFFSGELTLCGFDLMEMDIHKLGARIDNLHKDQTSEVSKTFLKFIGNIV